MGDGLKYVATFLNARKAIKANSFCIANGVLVTVIATPSNISSECGMSLMVESENVSGFEELMKKENIEYKIYEKI